MQYERPDFKELSKNLMQYNKEELKTFLIKNKKHFLNEFFLRFYLKYIFYEHEIIFNKNYKNTKIRPDAIIHDKKLIIEYDGPTHYTNNETILKDIKKDLFFKTEGYSVIRIPFFIEFGLEEMKLLFGNVDEDICSIYSSGFIHENVVLPSNFVERGINRFLKDKKLFLNNNTIKNKFWKTLIIKMFAKESVRCVLPPSLNFFYDEIIHFLNYYSEELKEKYINFENIKKIVLEDLETLIIETFIY